MPKIFYQKKAQSFLEYVVLLAVVAAALTAMYPYMRRAINARLKEIQIELNESKR